MSELFTGGRAESLRAVSRTYGIDLAKVTNVKDPDKKNRVKCKLVSNDANIGETNWAMVSTFMSGASKGATFLPSVGDMVLLGYLGGDVHKPVVIGSVWTGESAAPREYGSNGENDIRSIKTESGAEIIIDDTSGKEKISVTTKAGATLTLDDGGNSIKLQDKGAKNSIEMDTQKGEITIKASKKISLEAGSSKILLDGVGNKLSAEASATTEIKGATLKLDSTGTVEINANGSATLKSSGVTTVKGSMLKLN